MTLIDMSKFTDTERRIVQFLSDGYMHPVDEILNECMDEMSTKINLRPHLTSIRKKLRGTGLMINFVILNGRRSNDQGYMLSRSIANDPE